MLELNPFRKNRINLADYDHIQDIQNRIFFSGITQQELDVLEEILYSPLKFAIIDLAKNLELKVSVVKEILQKLERTHLIKIQGDTVLVDKEIRKYFDAELQKFDERFVPGMEFIQSILKKPPIHVLPIWYQIPRASDNIFESLVEKYFSTPLIYQRYLQEIKPADDVMFKIVSDLFHSKELKLDAAEMMNSLKLTQEQFHEYMLELEFNFICCIAYENEDGVWKEIITPFHEWKEYLFFIRDNQPSQIETTDLIELYRTHEFAFAEDLTNLLKLTSQRPIHLNSDLSFPADHIELIAEALQGFDLSFEDGNAMIHAYFKRLAEKAIHTGLADVKNNYFTPSSTSSVEWLSYSDEKKAHTIYKHPNNRFLNPECPQDLVSEKNIREIEKSLTKLVKLDWVYLEDFLKGIIASIGEIGKVELKKFGKNWKYTLPEYSEKEKLFIEITLLEWLFESGVIQPGVIGSKPCFRLTSLGKKLFS